MATKIVQWLQFVNLVIKIFSDISLIIITAAVRFHFEDRKIMIQTLTWMENSGRQQQQTSLHN